MYLDHLKSSQPVAVASSVSFSDVMQEAMYATEVCSAADAYLIKAEAEMLVLGSEAEGEGGFWAKVKTVVRKIWEAIKNLANKIYIFIKSIPGKIIAFCQKKFMMHVLKGLPEAWKKAKDDGRLESAKYLEIKYFDIDAIPELKNMDILSGINLNSAGAKEAVEKAREDLAKLRDTVREKKNDEDSDAWVDASTLNYSDVTELIDAAKSGKLPASATKAIKAFKDGTEAIRKLSDTETKKYDAAYRNKDQEAVKKITENLSCIRSMLVENATCTNFFASMTFHSLTSKIEAIKSVASIERVKNSKK